MLTSGYAHGRTEGERSSRPHGVIDELLQQADITLGGTRPWDIRLARNVAPERVFARGNLGLGESYMAGAWECDRLDQMFERVLRAGLERRVQPITLMPHVLRAVLFNRQKVARSWEVGQVHYDLGNDFYAAMLDPRMTYSCGYWSHAGSLAEAQDAKLEMICQKLRLEPGMRVLDIGCGWGSFMAYAAENHRVECVGVTISKEQAAWARQRYLHLPLEVRLQDYRALNERFDRVVSVGMFEHVGRKNHRAYMEVVHRCLSQGGLFLLHTIGKNVRNSVTDPWIDRYIFPNGDLPSIGQIGDACDGRFVVEDVHSFGADYDRTLLAWHANFISNWPRFGDRLGERFFRMWQYYLLSCAAAFRVRNLQLWQWVLSRGGIEGGYQRPAGSFGVAAPGSPSAFQPAPARPDTSAVRRPAH